MWNEAAARRSYYAYGADLIRTAGLLVGTSPSVTFRAATLFQRFEESVDRTYRCFYKKSQALLDEKTISSPCYGDTWQWKRTFSSSSDDEEGSDGAYCGSWMESPNAEVAETEKVEYLIADHVGKEMKSGLLPLADPFAPIDYCVSHIIDQEDISFLCAACLLIAVKMEDPSVRIRSIVHVFMRLSQRRCGIPVHEFLKPPPERYDDFKLCVVEAEELVLHQLGFQTFVECPYKYSAIFLRTMIVEEDADEAANRAYAMWLSRAVCWLNDVPRCMQLVKAPALLLAVCAIERTTPAGVTLPERWTMAFGVSRRALETAKKVYQSYLGKALVSSSTELEQMRVLMHKPLYKLYVDVVKEEMAAAEHSETDGPEGDAALQPASTGLVSYENGKATTPPPPNVTQPVLPNTAATLDAVVSAPEAIHQVVEPPARPVNPPSVTELKFETIPVGHKRRWRDDDKPLDTRRRRSRSPETSRRRLPSRTSDRRGGRDGSRSRGTERDKNHRRKRSVDDRRQRGSRRYDLDRKRHEERRRR